MNTLYMSSENNKTSDPHRLAFNLADEKYLKSCDKYISLSTIHRKITMDLKYQLQHVMMNSNYMMDHILYQILKIILWIL